MEMSRLITAIGVSVQEAQEFLSQKDFERYMQYFESVNAAAAISEDEDKARANDEDCALRPKAIRFALGRDERGYIDVPIVAMVPHATIGLKSVKVTVSGEMHEDERTKNVLMSAGPLQTEGTGTNNGTIEMVFACDPQSEGQARATQKMLDNTEF